LPSTATTGKTVQPKIIDAGPDKELWTGWDWAARVFDSQIRCEKGMRTGWALPAS